MVRHIILSLVCFCALAACTETPHPEGKPIARQTYDYVRPYGVAVSRVDIEQLYDPLALQGDVAGTFPTPPHIAIMDYARNRYKADGGPDIFRYVLEQASVTKRNIPQKNKWIGWTGLADEDEYRFFVVVGLYRVSPGQFSGPGVTIKMDRTLVIPQRKSIVEREKLQTEFVDKLIHDLDERIQLATETQLGL